jgi:putative glutamine amidotransferase
VARKLDGLILTGGDGLPRQLEGNPGTLPPDLAPVLPERLEAELALYRAVRSSARPVLGVCLGMQLMALEAGGSLSMDAAQEIAGARGHSLRRGRDRHGLHLLPGSTLERWWRDSKTTGQPEVNSSHLQAVRTLGDGFVAVAWADDGMVEAVESSAGLENDWRLGVQWHPEREGGTLGLDLVRRLVDACRARSRLRGRE